MSGDKLQQQIQRGDRARDLLENDLLNECFDDLQRQYTEALFLSLPNDEKTREKLYLAHNVCGKVKQHLQQMIANGKIARMDLDDRLAKEKREQP